MKTAVMPDSSYARRSSCFSGVHSWVLRAPPADSRATGPRATVRTDCTSILQIVAVGETLEDLPDIVPRQGAQVPLQSMRYAAGKGVLGPGCGKCPYLGEGLELGTADAG